MSGKKCSQFRLKREREKKLRLIQGIENFHAEVINLEKRVGNLLGEASEGIRSTFGAEVQRAQNWLDRVDLPNIKKMGEKTNLGILRKTHTDLKQMATGGRQVQEELIVAFTQKADKMGQHLTRRLAEVENLLGSGQHLLELWFDDNQRAEWENALQEAHQFLVEEQYPPLTQLLDEIEKDLIAKIKWAEEQESKQQKRLYLLKALRQVCGEMGFEEIDAPHYENKGDRGSRILFTVDTLDRGRIKFTLSLDEISTFSEIADDRCFEEFGQLSQYLEDEFGIETKFRLAEGEPPPKLIRKGELDLPDDAAMQSEV